MKRHLMIKALLCCACFCGLFVVSCAQTPPPPAPAAVSPVVSALKQSAIPFATSEAGTPDRDLQPLIQLIGNAQIVGLGEETHGTHEFFAMKQRIAEELLQKQGFTVFALENSWSSSLLIDQYIQTGQGDLQTLLTNDMFPTWQRSEFLDLITWMRAYNANPSHATKLHFAGVDVQTVDLSSFQNVVGYLQQIDPVQAARVQVLYQDLEHHGGAFASERVVPGIFKRYQGQAQQVYTLLQNHQASYIARSSPQAFALILQTARIIVQYTTLQAMGNINNSAAAYSLRDVYMAENVQWIYTHEANGGKMVLSAHNIHIANDPTYRWSVNHQENMGFYLRQRYGTAYLAIGMSFYQGSFLAYQNSILRSFQADAPLANSYNATLGQVGLPRYILDLRTLPAGPARAWAQNPRPFRVIGVPYDPVYASASYTTGVLSQWFDILIHFQNTTAAHPLPGTF